MAASPNDIIEDEVDILSTSRDEAGGTNSITAQIGDVGANKAYSDGVRWVQHVGFASRPAKPVKGTSAARGVVLNNSSNKTCFASTDLRCQAIYANLKEGETCLFGGGADGSAQGRVFCAQDGSITLYTSSTNKPNADASKPVGVYLRVGADGFRIETPWGRVTLGPEGFHVILPSGARIDLGGIGGLPAPFSSLGSYARITAATCHVNGALTALGPLPTLNAAGGAAAATPGISTVCSSSVVISP